MTAEQQHLETLLLEIKADITLINNRLDNNTVPWRGTTCPLSVPINQKLEQLKEGKLQLDKQKEAALKNHRTWVTALWSVIVVSLVVVILLILHII
jgi:hypothetical protein